MALDQFERKSEAADVDVGVVIVVKVGATIGKEEERKKGRTWPFFCSGLDFVKAEQNEDEVASLLSPPSTSSSSSSSSSSTLSSIAKS